MYPHTEYDLPILSLDVVAKDGVVSLGIIDPCPVSMTTLLPQEYSRMVRYPRTFPILQSSCVSSMKQGIHGRCDVRWATLT